FLSLPANVTDAGVAELKELTELREIMLAYSKITDDGVKHVNTFRNLESLSFYECRSTDKGMVQLKDLKKLRRLDLYLTDVTPAGVKELLNALPECEIYVPKVR